MVILCVVGVVIGARMMSIASRTTWLLANASLSNLVLLIITGGMVFYGGLFGFLWAIRIYAKFSNYESKNLYCLIAPAIPLFHGFGRIGCFLAGCCYGRYLATPLTLIGEMEIDKIPVQITESIFNFALFITIIILEKKSSDWDALRFYLLSYAIFRFAIEFLRGDEVRGFAVVLSTSQWISLIIMFYYTVVGIKYLLSKPIDLVNAGVLVNDKEIDGE